ncbi:MAG: glycosyltransferase [Vulcanimicrobiota bacterium]
MKILAGPDNWSFYTTNWRNGLADQDLLTFSQGKDGLTYQPGRSSFQDVLAQLPEGWIPDLVIWWFPEFQEVLPDIAECPYPTMAQISDWHTVRDGLALAASQFDLVATDRMGVSILQDSRAFEAPLYGFDPTLHRRLPHAQKTFDISHAGDLNPFLHVERLQALARAAEELGDEAVIRYLSGLTPEDYVWVLNQSRITINHTLRGEMSMRCYEAPACGSLLFNEAGNASLEAVFEEGRHYVAYTPENLVEKLRYYLAHEDERARLAEAGWERIQDFTYQRQGQRLIRLVEERLPQVDRSRRSRGSLLPYWSETVDRTRPPAVAYQVSHQALQARPDDVELLNLRGCVEARIGYGLTIDQRLAFFEDASQHLARALSLSCLVGLSLARVRWAAADPAGALRALKSAQETPFRQTAFFPREVGALHMLWEREVDRREANTRWQIYELLSQLVPEECEAYCRRALEFRPQAPLTLFRLALCLPAGQPERLDCLRRAVAHDPTFGPARLALIEELAAHGLRSEFDQQVRCSLNLALAFPHLGGLKSSLFRLLEKMAAPAAPPARPGLEDFLAGIGFAWLQPDEPVPQQLLDSMGTAWERQNTTFAWDQGAILARLSRLEDVPRMSTVAVAAVLQKLVQEMPDDQVFVNVGVWHGFSFLASLLDNPDKRCVGVDNFSQFGGPKDEFLERFQRLRGQRHSFYEMDYQLYFEQKHQGKLGVYLYDGEHSYHNQLRGLQVAEPHFAPGCLVLVDDTNWDEPRQASLDFIAQSSRDYELIFDVRTASNAHPTWWNGVMIWRCLT